MTGAGLDPDQMRLTGRIGLLKRGDIFEAVPGDHTVVGIGGGHQHCGVTHFGPDIMIGRIGQQRCKVGLLARIAIVVDPVTPGGEAVEAEHVHYPDRGVGSCEQVRALIDHRPDQEAAVRSALNCETVLRRNPAGDKIFARSDEVVEHVLLVGETPGVVPCLAVFAATTNVREDPRAALFKPCHPCRREAWSQRYVEPAIGVEQGRSRPGRTLFTDDEHRHPGAVLRSEEALFDQIIVGIELERRREPGAARIGFEIVAIDGRRPVEAGEGEEGFRIVEIARETACGAEPGQVDYPLLPSVKRMDPDLGARVLQIRDHELSAD